VNRALFEPDGELLVPTDLARGPWTDAGLNGGPVTGALVRGIEQLDEEQAFRLSRLTVELMRPAPFVPLRVETEPVRVGGRVGVVRAALLAGDQLVALATASRIAARPVELPPVLDPVSPPDGPEDGYEEGMVGRSRDETVRFHTHGLDIRTIGASHVDPGPATIWIRLTCALVAGEAITAAERAGVLSDAVGVGHVLPRGRYVHPNSDATLSLHRIPEGEWLRLACTSEIGPLGVGLVHGTLWDRAGAVGTATLTTVVTRIRP
jgi:hypothetical protein